MKRGFCVSSVIVLSILCMMTYGCRAKEKPITEEPVPGEKTMEEIIEDLTAPAAEEEPSVPDEVIESLTAPTSAPGQEETGQETSEGISQDIIDSLTAPE